MAVRRPKGAARPADGGGLVAVDATSGAGGLTVDPDEFDVYYLAPQKCFAADGGLWVALMSPGGDRAGRADRRQRSVDPVVSRPQDRDRQLEADQTYNTPALATLFLFVDQLEWMLGNGGSPGRRARCDRSAEIPLTPGRTPPTSPGRSWNGPLTGAMSSEPSTSSTRWTQPPWPRVLRVKRESSTPSPIASSAATSSGSRCSRPSSPTTSPRCAGCINYVVGALAS